MKRIALIIALLGLNLVIADDMNTNQDTNGGVGYTEDDTSNTINNSANNNSANSEENDSDKADKATSNTVDITRWNYTDEELKAKKDKADKKAAEEKEAYELNVTRKRSGAFIGAGMGYSGTNSNALGLYGNRVNGIGIGLLLGYQKAFNMYSGLRAYGEFDYNLGTGILSARIDNQKRKMNSNILKGLGNLDIYLEGNMGRNGTETLGAFFGLGVGYMSYAATEISYKVDAVVMALNAGIHTIIGNSNRVEIFLRWYPYISAPKNGNGTSGGTSGGTSKNPSVSTATDIWLRYSYIF